MRFTHLDILEQCFREKFRGYSNQEVDTFLQLVANDFKEMEEEIKRVDIIEHAQDLFFLFDKTFFASSSTAVSYP